MIRLEFEPHELNLIKQGLRQTGFAYLDPDNIIDQEHWILFKSLELHPDERPFRTRKLIVAVRITAIIRAAVTVACQNGMGPTAVTKLGFWKLVRAQLQDDKTFNSASNEELLAWKHMVEVYHAAWIRNAEQDPTSIRSHVAAPHSNSPDSYTLWDLHIAMAHWNSIMVGTFKAHVSTKGLEILQQRAQKEGLRSYADRLKGTPQGVRHWTAGWDMCFSHMKIAMEIRQLEEMEKVAQSACDNILKDRKIQEQADIILMMKASMDALRKEITQLKASNKARETREVDEQKEKDCTEQRCQRRRSFRAEAADSARH